MPELKLPRERNHIRLKPQSQSDEQDEGKCTRRSSKEKEEKKAGGKVPPAPAHAVTRRPDAGTKLLSRSEIRERKGVRREKLTLFLIFY